MSKPTAASKQKVVPSKSTTSKTVRTGSAPKTTSTKSQVVSKKSTTQTVVRLYEIDPNSGPVDTPHKVFLYGKNIDPTRVKIKFGAAPSVFLTEVPTVYIILTLLRQKKKTKNN